MGFALVSSKTVTAIRGSFYAALAIYLMKDPSKVLDNGIVLVIGRAMHLQDAGLDAPSSGIMTVLLWLLAIEDFINFSRNDIFHLIAVVPFRLFFDFIVCFFAYLNKDSSVFANALPFTFSFINIMLDFWLFLAVREDRLKLKNTRST